MRVFDHLGLGEAAALLVLALFVFGPDRLPSLAADLGRKLRRGRTLFDRLTNDLKQDLGPDLDDLGMELRQLQPRTIVSGLFEGNDDLPSRGADTDPRDRSETGA